MREAAPIRPDWRDAAPYVALAQIDAAGLAWEWLRRNPVYIAWWRAQALSEAQLLEGVPIVAALGRPRQWGLHFRRMPGSVGARRPVAVERRSRP